MTTKIIAAGSNELNAAEIMHVARRTVGDSIYMRSMLVKNITGFEDADIYVCGLSQQDKMLARVPADRLCVLDLRPTAEFFIKLSHIPAGETIYIFNSNKIYAQLLRDMCRAYQLPGLDFETIAYEDMPEEQVFSKLENANYIIGNSCLVGQNVLLSPYYAPHLRKNVNIIGSMRMATMESACELIEKVAAIEGDTFDNQRLQSQLMNTLAGQFSDALHAGNENEEFISQPNLESMLSHINKVIKTNQPPIPDFKNTN